MTETTRACIRGCTMYRYHQGDCEDQEKCRGCLPQRATNGLLCHTCHRRLELMLTDFPTIERWLTGNMSGSNGGGYDKPFVTGTKGDGPPLPIKAAIYDTRQLLGDQLAELVDDLAEMHDLKGPLTHDVTADSKWLLTWLQTLEWQDWVGDWWQALAETTSQAHALAPWRPEMRRLKGVPCPGCGETNLVIYGGETDVCCQSCRIIMTEDRFELWQRVLREERAAS